MDEAPVDAMAPWTIKAVSTETRNKVTIAARKEGLTVGQWLERRVSEWLGDGEPVRVSHGGLVPVSHGQSRFETRADHEELRALVQMARELSGDDKDASLIKLARATVRERLKAMRGGG